MDNKFDRIVREPFVMGGQPRIRDTNITVNEIVRLSLDGLSQTDILTKYPQLEAEDVHQAMGYGFNEVYWAIKFGASEINTHVAPIQSVAYFLGLSSKHSTDDLKLFADMLDRANQNIYTEIADLRNWTNHNFSKYHPSQMHIINLQKAIEDLRSRTAVAVNLNSPIPSEKIQIEVNHDFIFAIANLVSTKFRAIAYPHGLEKASAIQFSVHDKKLGVTIERKFIEPNEDKYRVEALTQIGTPESTTNQVLFQNRCELKVHQKGDSVIFEFELLLWEDTQD